MFYGIKSSAFLLHETKIGKGGEVERAGWRGSGRCPSPSAWAMTPHFFLHNFWHLPACNAGSQHLGEEEGHTLIVMLGEYCTGRSREEGRKGWGGGDLWGSHCRGGGNQLGAWLG